MFPCSTLSFFFFFNDTATTEIYTLSLHDALPIFAPEHRIPGYSFGERDARAPRTLLAFDDEDRKSTRLNSSHQIISYAVFCLKKKKKNTAKHMNKRGQTGQQRLSITCDSLHATQS